MFKGSVIGFLAVAAVLMTIISPSLASTVLLGRGECPNPGSMARFQISKFMGVWYEYQSFDRSATQCISAEYVDHRNGTIGVKNVGFIESKRFGQVTRRIPIRSNAVAYAPDPFRPAELRMTFYGDTDPSTRPNYIIVDTDYNSHAVVYSCSMIPGRGLNLQGTWILTRARGVAPVNLPKIKESLSAAGISVTSLKPSHQSNCPIEQQTLPTQGMERLSSSGLF